MVTRTLTPIISQQLRVVPDSQTTSRIVRVNLLESFKQRAHQRRKSHKTSITSILRANCPLRVLRDKSVLSKPAEAKIVFTQVLIWAQTEISLTPKANQELATMMHPRDRMTTKMTPQRMIHCTKSHQNKESTLNFWRTCREFKHQTQWVTELKR